MNAVSRPLNPTGKRIHLVELAGDLPLPIDLQQRQTFPVVTRIMGMRVSGDKIKRHLSFGDLCCCNSEQHDLALMSSLLGRIAPIAS